MLWGDTTMDRHLESKKKLALLKKRIIEADVKKRQRELEEEEERKIKKKLLKLLALFACLGLLFSLFKLFIM